MNEVLTVVQDWGPESLLALTTILLLWGKLLALPTVNKMLAAKDAEITAARTFHADQIAAQKLYYEGRISDINSAHTERGADLRHVADNQARALQTAVENAQKLIGQNDELLDLARAATPAIVAVRRAAEADSNDPE